MKPIIPAVLHMPEQEGFSNSALWLRVESRRRLHPVGHGAARELPVQSWGKGCQNSAMILWKSFQPLSPSPDVCYDLKSYQERTQSLLKALGMTPCSIRKLVWMWRIKESVSVSLENGNASTSGSLWYDFTGICKSQINRRNSWDLAAALGEAERPHIAFNPSLSPLELLWFFQCLPEKSFQNALSINNILLCKMSKLPDTMRRRWGTSQFMERNGNFFLHLSFKAALSDFTPAS